MRPSTFSHLSRLDDLATGRLRASASSQKAADAGRGRGILGQQVGERVADGLAVHLAGDQGGRVVRGTPVDVQLVVVTGENQVAARLGGLSGSLGGVFG